MIDTMTDNTVAVQALDLDSARRLLSEARNALALADDLLARLYAGRAWEALGHDDWPALCAAQLPELRHLKMRSGRRRERVAALLEHGATVRDIAAATGASVGTAHNDVQQLAAAATPAPDVDERPTYVRIADVVAAAGSAGLTIPQATRRTGWTPGAVSGALSRAERRGLVTRPTHLEQRGGFRPYTAPH